MKMIKLDSKEIEEGMYSFRATGINPHDGGVEAVYSQTYLVSNLQELREAKAGWIDSLRDRGYTKLEHNGTMQHERLRSFGSVYQVPKTTNTSFMKSIINKDTSIIVELSLSELNGEFILDI